MADVAAPDQTALSATANASADAPAVAPTRDPLTGKFLPGSPGGPGRPRRGQTYLDRLRAERDAHADQLAAHQVKQALKEKTPRFAGYLRDTLDGLPVRRIEVNDGSSPWLQVVMQALGGNGIDMSQLAALDGDVRELD